MSIPPRKYLTASSGLLVFLRLPPHCAAQNASLTGVVKDQQGDVVPNAVIGLIDLGKKVAVKTLTNQTGTFEFPILRPGLNQTNQFGNAGRNILTGPPLRDADVSFLKLFPVREHLAVQFRAECFNLTNTPNFGQPGNSVTAANFGVIQTM